MSCCFLVAAKKEFSMENNLGVPRCGIVARDDNGMPLLDKRRHRVVPQVPHQSQDLVGDGTDLQGDVPLPVWVSQHVSKFVVYILNIIFRGLKFHNLRRKWAVFLAIRMASGCFAMAYPWPILSVPSY